MSTEKKNIVLVSASPKVGEATVSGLLAAIAEKRLADNANVTNIDVRRSISGKHNEENFKAMNRADAIVFIFPLYIYCLPGILMRFLQDYRDYRTLHTDMASNPKVYAVVNCGFPEAYINSEAVRVIKSFSKHTGASFRFGILLGGGGMLLGAKDAPFMKKFMAKLNDSFDRIANDVSDSEIPEIDNICVSLNFPRKLYYLGGNLGWRQMAKKNGLKKKDLYARPYIQ